MKKGRGGKIWVYLDGEKLCDAVQAALDNNKFIFDLQKKLIEENPGHEITIKIEK